uniref:Uncharacterized protein n=1 Tax=Triticum aestivum TaxID=4565 RepID=A0A3B5XZ30_WHEAT
MALSGLDAAFVLPMHFPSPSASFAPDSSSTAWYPSVITNENDNLIETLHKTPELMKVKVLMTKKCDSGENDVSMIQRADVGFGTFIGLCTSLASLPCCSSTSLAAVEAFFSCIDHYEVNNLGEFSASPIKRWDPYGRDEIQLQLACNKIKWEDLNLLELRNHKYLAPRERNLDVLITQSLDHELADAKQNLRIMGVILILEGLAESILNCIHCFQVVVYISYEYSPTT